MLHELCSSPHYVPVIIAHFFNKPIQNSKLLWKLYLEKDYSIYEISYLTGWPRSSISDATRALGFKKEAILKVHTGLPSLEVFTKKMTKK